MNSKYRARLARKPASLRCRSASSACGERQGGGRRTSSGRQLWTLGGAAAAAGAARLAAVWLGLALPCPHARRVRWCRPRGSTWLSSPAWIGWPPCRRARPDGCNAAGSWEGRRRRGGSSGGRVPCRPATGGQVAPRLRPAAAGQFPGGRAHREGLEAGLEAGSQVQVLAGCAGKVEGKSDRRRILPAGGTRLCGPAAVSSAQQLPCIGHARSTPPRESHGPNHALIAAQGACKHACRAPRPALALAVSWRAAGATNGRTKQAAAGCDRLRHYG